MDVIQMFGMLQQLKTNPMSLLSKKFNIPDGVNLSDPNEIINHLVNSGQVNQSQIDNIKNQFNGYMK